VCFSSIRSYLRFYEVAIFCCSARERMSSRFYTNSKIKHFILRSLEVNNMSRQVTVGAIGAIVVGLTLFGCRSSERTEPMGRSETIPCGETELTGRGEAMLGREGRRSIGMPNPSADYGNRGQSPIFLLTSLAVLHSHGLCRD